MASIDYRVMDAERIELGADSIDGVLCQNGYMLMADPAVALAETRRVLRTGGRLALSVWGTPERNPWASVGGMILIQGGHMPAPEPGAPGVFAMAIEARTRGIVRGCRVQFGPNRGGAGALRLPRRRRLRAMGRGRRRPFAMVLRGLPEEERQMLKDRPSEAFMPFVVGARYELPGVALCAVAT